MLPPAGRAVVLDAKHDLEDPQIAALMTSAAKTRCALRLFTRLAPCGHLVDPGRRLMETALIRSQTNAGSWEASLIPFPTRVAPRPVMQVNRNVVALGVGFVKGALMPAAPTTLPKQIFNARLMGPFPVSLPRKMSLFESRKQKNADPSGAFLTRPAFDVVLLAVESAVAPIVTKGTVEKAAALT